MEPTMTDHTEQAGVSTVLERTPRGEGEIGGMIQMSDDVVAMVAGLAAREIPGIHSLGRSRIFFGTSTNPRRGVAVEVGQKEAALDLEVVIEHGCDIRQVAGALRRRIAKEVNLMTGRRVVEVNLDVVGIHYEPAGSPPPAPEQPRVH